MKFTKCQLILFPKLKDSRKATFVGLSDMIFHWQSLMPIIAKGIRVK